MMNGRNVRVVLLQFWIASFDLRDGASWVACFAGQDVEKKTRLEMSPGDCVVFAKM